MTIKALETKPLPTPTSDASTPHSKSIGPDAPQLTLIQRLHKIMAEVPFIAKDKTNTFHKYAYASEQAIKEALHPKLVEHGVMFIYSITDVRHDHGEDSTLTTITLHYRFIDVATGETMEGTFAGTGQDSGDKGLFKAITGGLKYLLTSTFLIPTGDDPENDEKAPQNDKYASRPAQGRGFAPRPVSSQPDAKLSLPRRISDAQVSRMWAIARKSGWDDAEVKEFLAKKGYASSSDVPVSDYDAICSAFEVGVDG